jgi:hypothetical protein
MTLVQVPLELDGRSLLPRFDSSFLEDHAGRIVTDPKIAVVELVANCWDAGADRVDITWPETPPGPMAIRDNGTGMTRDEFIERWRELNYNRVQHLGEDVDFPPDNQASRRKAFGRNGKGRHSMFCFAGDYIVETWRDRIAHRFRVARTSGGSAPFEITPIEAFPQEGHGTIISAILTYNYLSLPALRDLIGSKFVADPSFRIYTNGEVVELTDLEHLCETEVLSVDGLGTVLIRRFDSRKTGRTSKQHGVAWWVNKRLVGEQSWHGIDIPYLDGRSAEAKRYTFVVEADILADQVRADWSWFRESDKTQTVLSVVERRILELLQELLKDVRRSRKITALEEHRQTLRELPSMSRYTVGKFLDEIQIRCPTVDQRVLSQTVEVLANLEKSRSRYTLLEQLAQLGPRELDKLSTVLERWHVQDLQMVLDELEWRLKLIERLEALVEDPTSDELHDIQPLFEKGLWIFGPEYEGADFIANRWLATIIRDFFKGDPAALVTPQRRPDIVALPNASISAHKRAAYDKQGEISGVGKVLIIELKRGGFEITRKERQQAQEYANEIRKSGKVQHSTEIVGFVLGTTIAEDATEPVKEGATIIYPRTYSVVLRQAHARTFNLLRRLNEVQQERLVDAEVEQVVSTPEQLTLESVNLRPKTVDGSGDHKRASTVGKG